MKCSYQIDKITVIIILSITFFLHNITYAAVDETDLKNAVLLLQVLAGESPQIDYSQIPDKFGDNRYGIPEVINLLLVGNTVNAPLKPTNLTSSPSSNNVIALNWDAMDNTSYYRIFRSTVANGSYVAIDAATSNRYDDSDTALVVNQSYFYKVSGCNVSNDCSDLSSYTEAPLTTTTSATYYVAMDGNDTNPGTTDLPWRSLQKAVDTMEAGATAIIRPGDYDESVTINGSGVDENDRITLRAEYYVNKRSPNTLQTSKTRRFTIKRSFVSIEGLEIEAGAVTASGINIEGCDGVEIKHNYIHDCPYMGIIAFYKLVDIPNSTEKDIKYSNYSKFISNRIYAVAQVGITLFGMDGLIEDNDITDIVEDHYKIPPIPDAGDADGIRIFGDRNIIRNNRIINFADMSSDAHGMIDDAHADCIQTSYSGHNSQVGDKTGSPVMSHTLIEGNFCQSEHVSSKGIMIDSRENNPCEHLTIRNNIFEILDIGVAAYTGSVENISIYNNIVRSKLKDILPSRWSAGIVVGPAVANHLVANNIVINAHEPLKVNGVLLRAGQLDPTTKNTAWNSYSNVTPPASETDNDPLFVDFSGNFNESDYHLTTGSPIKDEGVTIAGEQKDFDGVSRPQGLAFEIGPYEVIPN